MKTVAVIAFLCSAVVAQAQVDPIWQGNYFCKASHVGGVAFNEQTKTWTGTTFRPRGQFVLSVREAPKEVQAQFTSTTTENPGQYYVTVSEMGQPGASPLTCEPVGAGWGSKKPVLIFKAGYLQCEHSLSTLKISFATMRYLNAYLQGYIGGQDNNDNTPSIEIGTCAKID